jgi:hypothetical protein
MMIKASGRSALILATGLLVCLAGPASAAGGDSATPASKSASANSGKSIKHGSRHWRRHAHRKHSRPAPKSAETSKTADKDTADASKAAPEIPASVANANAEMGTGDPATEGANASAKASASVQATADKPAGAQAPTDAVAASDQLNDVDRALQETPAPQTVGIAPIKPAVAAPAQASDDHSSSWAQASLLGKIFIGFGALLTMASAARMFMA